MTYLEPNLDGKFRFSWESWIKKKFPHYMTDVNRIWLKIIPDESYMYIYKYVVFG